MLKPKALMTYLLPTSYGCFMRPAVAPPIMENGWMLSMAARKGLTDIALFLGSQVGHIPSPKKVPE